MAKTKTKIERYPDAIAWENWLKVNKASADARTLGATARASEYLANRLIAAWQAGVEYGRRTPEGGEPAKR